MSLEKSSENEAMLEYWNKMKNKNRKRLLEPYIYTVKIPKQQFIVQMVGTINHWTKLPEDKVKLAKESLNMLYDGITIQDDIEDGNTIRRKNPAPYRIYGIARSYMTSNAILLELLSRMIALNNFDVIRVFSEEILRLYDGKYHELSIRESMQCPTVDEYMELAVEKALGGFYFFVRLMQVLSGFEKDLLKFTRALTLWFQVQNDYCSVAEEKYWKNRGMYSDIIEGTFSLPIVHAINTNTHEGKVVYNIIRSKDKDAVMVKRCLKSLEKLGSIAFTKQKMFEAEKQLREEVEKLGGNPSFLQYIDKFYEYKNDEVVYESSDEEILLKC